MLILSRKQGESLELSELGVVVKVISLKKSKVQLGIEAPPQITVNRSEIAADRTRDDVDVDRHGGQQIFDDVAHIEGELAALAELADPKDRAIARQVAADSIQRLTSIRRTLRMAMHQRCGTRPISDFVKVRSEVLEHLRGDPQDDSESEHAAKWPRSQSERTSCVHQAPSGYAIVPPAPARSCVAM
jgi:carbon storage regulator CsrA